MAMQSAHQQRGASAWNWMVLAVLIILVGSFLLRVVPHYMTYFSIQRMFEQMPADTHADMSRKEIVEFFQKRFRIEGVGLNAREYIVVTRNKQETLVSLEYEMREPLLYNADIVLSFSEQRTFK